MANDPDGFMAELTPTAARPLLGVTVLVVEDSRYACEALRLICLRSGARIRRADCLRSARRHLQSYRPMAVIVDLGLPDGSGLDLIAEIAARRPRVPALVATSGDGTAEARALAAGADAFLPKPLESVRAFQSTILAALPHRAAPGWREAAPEDRVSPDPLALRDDFSHVAELLSGGAGETLDYVAQFLSGIALSTRDDALWDAAEALTRERGCGGDGSAPVARISGLVQARLTEAEAF